MNNEIFNIDYIEGDLIIKNCPEFRNTGDIEQQGTCLYSCGEYCLEIEKLYYETMLQTTPSRGKLRIKAG